jgi:hypothetical protein
MDFPLRNSFELPPCLITGGTLWSWSSGPRLHHDHRLLTQRDDFVAGQCWWSVGGMSMVNGLNPPAARDDRHAVHGRVAD